MEKREIKFRAFMKKAQYMIQPCCAEIYKDGSYCGGETHGTSTDCILMQYTGLKDKNGKEIYEGDIIVFGIDSNKQFPRAVEWYILGLRVKQINGDANFPLHYPFVGQTGLDTDWEIIGNVYENPDLLK